MNFNELSDEEQHVILVRRGKEATGFDHHTDSRGRHYFWPMGEQPSGAVLNEIAADTVPKAAEKFVSVYLRRSEMTSNPARFSTYPRPQRRDAAPSQRITPPYRRFAYQSKHMDKPLIDQCWHKNDERAMERRDDFVCWLDPDWIQTAIPEKA